MNKEMEYKWKAAWLYMKRLQKQLHYATIANGINLYINIQNPFQKVKPKTLNVRTKISF